jgi:uncharacterized protein (DUF302 family)
MEYYFTKTLQCGFDEAIERVTARLGAEGFGVLTEIDVQATLKKKLGVDFRKYRILGACNPPFAYEALTAESRIGLMLPCNVVIQETGSGDIEVSAVNPPASMAAVKNDRLETVAAEVSAKLERVISGM